VNPHTRAYETGYYHGYDGEDYRPWPSYADLERVCYRAGYYDGRSDLEAADAISDVPLLGESAEETCARYEAAVSRQWRKSFDPPGDP